MTIVEVDQIDLSLFAFEVVTDGTSKWPKQRDGRPVPPIGKTLVHGGEEE